MFLCSRSLRRVHLPKLCSSPPSVPRVQIVSNLRNALASCARSTLATPARDERCCLSAGSGLGSVHRRSPHLANLTDQELIALLQKARADSTVSIHSEHTQSSGDNHTEHFVATEAGARERSSGIVETYMELRRRGRNLLEEISPDVFVRVARNAGRTRSTGVLDSVVSDVIMLNEAACRSEKERGENIDGFTPTNFSLALQRILRLKAVAKIGSRRHDRVLNLCRALLLARGKSSALPHLSADTLIHVVRSIVAQPLGWEKQNLSLLTALLEYLESFPTDFLYVNKHSDGVEGEDPPRDSLAWDLFLFIQSMVIRGHNHLALSFLQVLVQKDTIPLHALRRSSRTTGDFRTITMSALLQACIYYKWPGGALRLLKSEDLANKDLLPHYTKLVNDTLRAFIPGGTTQQLEHCSRLISYVVTQDPAILPDGVLVRRFYNSAHSLNAGNAAEILYAALRSPPVVSCHVFGLPDGAALPWLLKHIVQVSKNSRVGKLCAQHLVESPEPPQLYDRGEVIYLCASGSYVGETRMLWERCASMRDKHIVTGHARCMLSIVKLYCKLDAAERINRERKERGLRWRCVRLGVKALREPTALVTNLKLDEVASYSAQERKIKALVFDERPDDVGPQIRPLQEQIVSAEADHHMIDLLPQGEAQEIGVAKKVGYVSDSSSSTSKTGEHYNFARTVFNAFRLSKEPLVRAAHYDLNALSKAAELLGSVQLSTRTLQVLLERQEVPDIHDLNVVVAATAARNPEHGELMLMLMLERGIGASSHTFSAVMNVALASGDITRASRVYGQALRLGLAELLPNTAEAFLKACLNVVSPLQTVASRRESVGGADVSSFALAKIDPQAQKRVEKHKVYMQQVYALVTSEVRPVRIRTAQLGARCVDAALRAEEAGLAFRFWKILVESRAAWDSVWQKNMRRVIADMIRKDCGHGQLGESEGARMLAELGERR
ncbi:hypothetical protein DFH11DRAFT_1877634 [Phellopilus nigrolimitatus]|nr:hypothetical protein DFH11DRAFT_1877634 [Phellopilus nigrolimitatus]